MRFMTACRVAGSFILPALLCALPAAGETITLQQGAGGYDGCVTETISSDGKAQAAPAGAMALRGSRNYLRLRFDLPAKLRSKRLARARLEVFVPEVRKLRMICEIACGEVQVGQSNPGVGHRANE